MTYGIEIRNSDGDLVIDEENEVVLVAEKNTISGQRSSYPILNGSPSLYGDYNHQWYVQPGNGAVCCVYLENTYDDPPIVAVRGESGGYNILLPTVRMFRSTGVNTDPIDRLFFRCDLPRSIDYIVCCGASEAPASSRAVGTDDYGLQVTNSSAEVIFDTRWPAIVSCTSLNTFPSGVDVSITIGSPPGPFTTTINKTNQSVTIPSTPAGFFVVTGLTGSMGFYYATTSGQGGEPIENFGGGVFHPSLIQTNDTTVTATCVRVLEGLPGTAGQQYVDNAFNGNFQVLRYLDF